MVFTQTRAIVTGGAAYAAGERLGTLPAGGQNASCDIWVRIFKLAAPTSAPGLYLKLCGFARTGGPKSSYSKEHKGH